MKNPSRPNPDGGHLIVAVVVALGADELRLSGRSRHHVSRLRSEFSSRADRSRCLVSLPPFAAASLGSETEPAPAPSAQGKYNFDLALSADYVAKTLPGTSVYTVSNSNDEFVLISDPSNSLRSLGIFCIRKEDAQTLLAQVKLRQPILGRGSKVVPIVLDQLRSADISQGFDGVPVFQEVIERELLKASKASRGSGLYQNIMVGSFEEVLKMMEMNDKNSGWDDLLFIPPGKSYTQRINEVAI